jgi:hypothetical protein
MRRFFRDLESAGNLEDGMEFHAAGVVIDRAYDDEASTSGITVLYMNPYTTKVEKRSRDFSTVVLYNFTQDDRVYWWLWEQTRAKLEKLLSEQ